MNLQQIQELAESILIAALNGGELAGFVFRHNDTPQKTVKDMIVVQSGAPEQILSGPKPCKIPMTITMQSKTSGRLAAIHGVCLARLKDFNVMRAACFTAGLKETDDFVMIYEEMSGDESDTQHLRKRTITLPVKIAVN